MFVHSGFKVIGIIAGILKSQGIFWIFILTQSQNPEIISKNPQKLVFSENFRKCSHMSTSYLAIQHT